MSCFKGFLCYDGTEVINHAQSAAYINNLGISGLTEPLDATCVCDGLGNHDYDGNPIPWTNPVADDAWWYDPKVPASADVIALWVDDFVVSAPYDRDAKAKLFGAALGPGTYGKREIVITGWVYTRSEQATEYMRNALHEVFVGSDCSNCTPPDLLYWVGCPNPDDDTDLSHVRTVRQCGMTGALQWNLEPTFPCCWGAKWQVTITSEVPWLALTPTTIHTGPILVNEPLCNICNPCPTFSTVDFDCGCLAQTVRVVPEPVAFGCFSAPLTVSRDCFIIEASSIWRTAVVNFKIYSGDAHNADGSGLRNLRIRGWPNPDGLATAPEDIICTDPCIDVEISCLPADATFTIDSLSRTAKITKSGATSRGARFLTSGGGERFTYPNFDCPGLFICVDADGEGTSPTATLRIDTQEYERG